MSLNLRHQRFDHSFSEGRMIFVDVPKGYIETGTEAVAGFAIGTVKFGSGIGQDVFKGIYNAWNSDTQSESAKNEQLLSVSEFSRTMPSSIQKIIEKKFKEGERPKLEDLAKIFDHRQWIDMFKKPDFFDADQNEALPLSQGPESIFLALTQDKRQELYCDYVDQLIPPSVRKDEKHQGLREFIGSDTKLNAAGNVVAVSRPEKIRTVNNHRDTINRSMEAILGINPIAVPNNEPEAYELADTALLHHYWRDGLREDPDTGEAIPFALTSTKVDPVTGKQTVSPYGLKPQLMDDFAQLTRNQPLLDNLDEVEKKLPPSVLKGALNVNMSVVTSDDVPTLQTMLSEKATKRQEVKGKTSQDVTKLRGVRDAEYTRTAETLGQTFSKLSGTEKALLIFLAYKAFKDAAPLMTGLTALYFGQKFLGGEKDPLNDSWKPLVQGLAGKVKGFTQPAFDSIGLKDDKKKYTDADIQQRIAIVERYLTENAKTDLDTSVAGFEILGDMKLSQLRSVFAISDDGSLATIRYDDSPFKKEARRVMGNHGSKEKATEKFFGGADPKNLKNPNDLVELSRKYTVDTTHDYTVELGTDTVNKHVLDAGHALSTVFYSLAVRDEKYKDGMKQIEYFRRTYGLGTYEDLPDQEYEVDYNNDGKIDHLNPRKLYVYLVRAGADLASDSDMTLMEFMTSQISQTNTGANAPKKAPRRVAAAPQPNPPNNLPPQPPQPPPNPPNNQPPNPPGAPPNPPNNLPTQPPAPPPNQPNNPGAQPPAAPPNPANNPGAQPPPAPPGNPNNQPPNPAGAPPAAPTNPPASPPAAQPAQPTNSPPNTSNTPSPATNASPNAPASQPSQPTNAAPTAPTNPSQPNNSLPNTSNTPSTATNRSAGLSNNPSAATNASPNAAAAQPALSNSVPSGPQPSPSQPKNTAPNSTRSPEAASGTAPNAPASSATEPQDTLLNRSAAKPLQPKNASPNPPANSPRPKKEL